MKLIDVFWSSEINILRIEGDCQAVLFRPANVSLVSCPCCGMSSYWHDFSPKNNDGDFSGQFPVIESEIIFSTPLSVSSANPIEAIDTDITQLKVDAIVNAANESLLGGGGVDGAIHSVSGPELLEECRELKGCLTGQAKITKGYRLPASYVIHAAGPVWHGGNQGEESLLQSCYRNSLQLAVENKINTIAFPAISCGCYRFPLDKACHISVATIQTFLSQNNTLKKICLCALDQDLTQAWEQALDSWNSED